MGEGSIALQKACSIDEDVTLVANDFSRWSCNVERIFVLLVNPSCRLYAMFELDESMKTVFSGDLFKVLLDFIGARIAMESVSRTTTAGCG